MDKEPITFHGLEKIKKELEELKNIKRPKIIEAIAEARGHGDLKENAEYHAAKEEQAKIEGRIIEINDLIARANVIDVTKLEKEDKVIFGSTTVMIDLKNNVCGKITGSLLFCVRKLIILLENFLFIAMLEAETPECV